MLPAPIDLSHVLAGTKYARDVLDGKITACLWIRLACKRHFDDLERSRAGNWKYYFDLAEAEKWCRFIEKLPHIKGKWAREKRRIKLEPWQCFKTMVLMGWKRFKDHTRRFRKAFILEPRKNAKSTWAAGIGLGMLTIDGEAGAEIYSGATTEKQAWEVFGPARLMAKRLPTLVKRFGLDVMAKSIASIEQAAKFEPLIGDPGDGSSPHMSIVDEYHEHDTDRLVDTMLTGMGARDQPLLLIISTAGSNLAGPCYSYQKEVCEKVLQGLMEDDELFVLIYTIDKGVKWDSIEALRMANPNMGVSVNEDFLLSQLHAARNDPRRVAVYKTKHLNMWVQSREGYFNVAKFQSLATEYTLEDFRNQPCIIGLDLAEKVDITAKVYLFDLEKCDCPAATKLINRGFRYFMTSRFYLPSETVDEPQNDHYRAWREDKTKNFVVHEGEAVDYLLIEDDIDADLKMLDVLEIAFDPHQARMLMTRLATKGVDCVEVRPIVLNFSEPMKQKEAWIRGGKLAHDGNPVYEWMLSCVTFKQDEKGNVYPTKDKNQRRNKIDGPVAGMMTIARMMSIEEERESVYATRGILRVG